MIVAVESDSSWRIAEVPAKAIVSPQGAD